MRAAGRLSRRRTPPERWSAQRNQQTNLLGDPDDPMSAAPGLFTVEATLRPTASGRAASEVGATKSFARVQRTDKRLLSSNAALSGLGVKRREMVLDARRERFPAEKGNQRGLVQEGTQLLLADRAEADLKLAGTGALVLELAGDECAVQTDKRT